MKPIKQTTWLTIMIIILLGISVAQMVNMRFTYQKISTLQDAVLILQNIEIDRQLAEAKEYESPLPPEEIAPIVPIDPFWKNNMPNLFNDGEEEEKAEIIIPRALPKPFDPYEFPKIPEFPPLPDDTNNIPETPPLPEMPEIKDLQLDMKSS